MIKSFIPNMSSVSKGTNSVLETKKKGTNSNFKNEKENEKLKNKPTIRLWIRKANFYFNLFSNVL